MSLTEEDIEAVIKVIRAKTDTLTVAGYISFLDSVAYEINLLKLAAQADLNRKHVKRTT